MVPNPDWALDLGSIDPQTILAVSLGTARTMAEACICSLVSHSHPNGVGLQWLSDDGSAEYKVIWPASLESPSIQRAFNRDDASEKGAEAIALLWIRDRTQYTAINRSATGTGIDYWLGPKDSDPELIFNSACARLEVSGIHRENSGNTVNARVSLKRQQVDRGERRLPVYIIIVEFSQPKARMVLEHAKHS
jgi:hypothetical protein